VNAYQKKIWIDSNGIEIQYGEMLTGTSVWKSLRANAKMGLLDEDKNRRIVYKG
jgi:hypothetical protein